MSTTMSLFEEADIEVREPDPSMSVDEVRQSMTSFFPPPPMPRAD